ncbi:MAG: ATP-binding protein [Candidatus Hydrogenedentes bacterium]|nr:ATP-binding protein [Candidatus Hydrogenedentota bacterium]
MKTEEQKLISEITKNQQSGKVSIAKLRTDDRVLARITDGIYRQPASALRELISNAYDADATNVIIQTDAPRFRHITVRDDGNGMDVAALARLIHHIGGSVKRRVEGATLGITGKRDPSLSPKGRRLIGKIGIGLFSVSQLTRHFQIVTKVKGNPYRLIAEVILRTYTEDTPRNMTGSKPGAGDVVETGTVRIISAPADDASAHGTEVILMDLRPQARDVLQSKEMWDLIDSGAIGIGGEKLYVRHPSYHIGQVDGSTDKVTRKPSLPWHDEDEPEVRFRSLYQSLIDEINTTEQNPRLETALDNYLRTLWTLSLSAPVDYIECHPFDLAKSPEIDLYLLKPRIRGQAKPLALSASEKVREKLGLHAPERGPSRIPFCVLIDDVQLLRSIRFFASAIPGWRIT